LIGWVCEMASADGCCMPGSSQARMATIDGTSNDRACTNQNDVSAHGAGYWPP
jgi:hypothetical protein